MRKDAKQDMVRRNHWAWSVLRQPSPEDELPTCPAQLLQSSLRLDDDADDELGFRVERAIVMGLSAFVDIHIRLRKIYSHLTP